MRKYSDLTPIEQDALIQALTSPVASENKVISFLEQYNPTVFETEETITISRFNKRLLEAYVN